MSQPKATWVWGDDLKVLELHIEKSPGVPFDLTGATVTLIGQRGRDPAPPAISAGGTLSATPTDGIVTFTDLTADVVMGTSGEVSIPCRAKIFKGGKTGWTEVIEVDIERPPPEVI